MATRHALLSLAALLLAVAPMAQAAEKLVKPGEVIADKSLPKAARERMVQAALRYDTFWNTGDESLARAALAPAFKDNTLPPGRPQGVEGPIAASKMFRSAVPDLTCDVDQLIVSGDRVVALLHFKGHFTGEAHGKKGTGQAVDFIATDIYRIVNGRIVEDWHLEDNLTLLKQLGVIQP
jgi:predicted ester cyclase